MMAEDTDTPVACRAHCDHHNNFAGFIDADRTFWRTAPTQMRVGDNCRPTREPPSTVSAVGRTKIGEAQEWPVGGVITMTYMGCPAIYRRALPWGLSQHLPAGSVRLPEASARSRSGSQRSSSPASPTRRQRFVSIRKQQACPLNPAIERNQPSLNMCAILTQAINNSMLSTVVAFRLGKPCKRAQTSMSRVRNAHQVHDFFHILPQFCMVYGVYTGATNFGKRYIPSFWNCAIGGVTFIEMVRA
jgi:hypothetical protein